VLDQSFETMRTLLENNVGVQFVTKGIISDRFFDLFAKYPRLVSGQIGICSLDQSVADIVEPAAAPIAVQIETASRQTWIRFQKGFGGRTATRACYEL